MKNLLTQFKRWTGHEAMKLLSADQLRGFWQNEWFDHWSRSTDQDEQIKRYIRNNPVKAGLVKDYKEWAYGSWTKL